MWGVLLLNTNDNEMMKAIEKKVYDLLDKVNCYFSFPGYKLECRHVYNDNI